MKIDPVELYQIIDELRATAIQGLRYSENGYEKERCERFLNTSARLASMLEDRPVEEIYTSFSGDLTHVSPVSTVDALVMREGRLLLIQRKDNGLWAMPGGLCEVGETPAQGAERELWEEVGIHGHAVRLLGLFDSRIANSRSKLHMYMSVFLVESDDALPERTHPIDEVSPRAEILDAGFFDPQHLPALSPGHDKRIPIALQVLHGEIATPFFDLV